MVAQQWLRPVRGSAKILTLFLISLTLFWLLHCMLIVPVTPDDAIGNEDRRSLGVLFWAGELFITHTCNERNHKLLMEGHSQSKLQATVMSWKEANTEVCKTSACQAK